MWADSHCHRWLFKMLQPFALYLSTLVTRVAKHFSTCLPLWYPSSSVISLGALWVKKIVETKQKSQISPCKDQIWISDNPPWPESMSLTSNVEFDGLVRAHLKNKSYGGGAQVPLKKWGGRVKNMILLAFILMTAFIQQACWFEFLPREEFPEWPRWWGDPIHKLISAKIIETVPQEQ